MYKIQKAVTKPRIARKGPPEKYPFSTMAVGDMFFVPDRKKNTVAPHASKKGRALGRKFSTRMLWMHQTKSGVWVTSSANTPKAVYGVGVWRDA